MMRDRDNRLSAWEYRATLERVITQFALIRFALRTLRSNEISDFLKMRSDEELKRYKEVLETARKAKAGGEGTNCDEIEEHLMEGISKKHQKEYRPSDNRVKVELSEDRLNQSELLLLVAHFESFLTDVHRTFLLADPAKVFGRSSGDLNKILVTRSGKKLESKTTSL